MGVCDLKKIFINCVNPAAAVLTALVMPCSAVYSSDNTKTGYGQGTAVDSLNRPVDALAFNEKYRDLNAFAISNEEKRIIITFDQGYENGYTSQILDTLRDKKVKALFFLTGDYAKKEKALVTRMITEGHMIGNHGMTHASLPTLSEKDAVTEIMSLHKYVLDNYGYEMQYFRCPCGEYSEQALETINKCGYKTVFWSFAYVDWQTDNQPSPDFAMERLTQSAHSGEILLLHSVSSTNAQILGQLIDTLRNMGYNL